MSAVMSCPRCWGARTDGPNPCLLCAGSGSIADRMLSSHFALSELIASQTAVRHWIPNDPPPAVVDALTELAQFLEHPRAELGPIHIDSGYRSKPLNIAVGGASDSAHVQGDAGDCVPLQVSKRRLFDWIAQSGLAFDQLIWEFGSWVHVGVKGPHGIQRRQLLMIFADGKGYRPFDPNDPRCA